MSLTIWAIWLGVHPRAAVDQVRVDSGESDSQDGTVLESSQLGR